MCLVQMKLLIIFYLFINRTSCTNLEESGLNSTNTVEEIQHANCKILTKDIQASANATITRQLKGVCTSKEMNYRLDRLEKLIYNELNTIKDALKIPRGNGLELKALEKATSNMDAQDFSNTIESVKTNIVYNAPTVTNLPENINNTVSNKKKLNEAIIRTEKPSTTSNEISSNNSKNLEISYKRDLEAAKFNKTTQTTELGKTYLYYWKIYDIHEILNYTNIDIESPVFYTLGSALQIKMYPHHLGTKYVSFELSKNLRFKHRFTILNQLNEQGDLTSQILGNKNAVLYKISTQKLENGEFTFDGSLLVKVAIALNFW